MPAARARPFVGRAAQHQRIRRPQHRMQIQHHVGAIDRSAGSPAPVPVRSSGAARPASAASHTRLMSSSMKRDRVGWRGSNRSNAARLTKPKVSRPRVGVRSAASSRSSATAPAISLPCASASTTTCGPGRRAVAAGEAGDAGVAFDPGADVGRGEAHLEEWQRWRGGRGHVARGSGQQTIRQAADECVAGVELALRHELVRLMRLRDVARAADDRRNAGILVIPALGAVAYLAGAVRAGELLHDRRQFVVRHRAPGAASG